MPVEVYRCCLKHLVYRIPLSASEREARPNCEKPSLISWAQCRRRATRRDKPEIRTGHQQLFWEFGRVV